MTNPFEFREVMRASVGYDERTPEQVLAEQKRRHAATAAARTSSKGRRSQPAEAPAETTDIRAIPKAALAELDRLRNGLLPVG